MTRHITAWLWRFEIFRHLCVALMCRGWFVAWIGENTPFWFAMWKAALAHGDLGMAREYGAIYREIESGARFRRVG